MRIMKRLSSFDTRLWSDVNIAGLPVGLKRCMLALIPAVIILQGWFDWKTAQDLDFAWLRTYNPMVGLACSAILVVLISSVLGLTLFGRSRVAP